MCPYRFFLNYGLGIKEREEWEISKADLGSYAHEVIEKFCKRVEEGASTPEEKLAEELIEILSEIEISAGLTLRRSQFIVYIKGSESIEDTLTFINAQQCTLELINVKIYKDMRNKINRQTNCDNANISRTINVALKQIKDIELIAKTKGLDSLSDELRQVAELRLEDTSLSLKDIGESLEPPISRSGVNHRLMKIAKIADEIRNSGGQNGKK